MVEQKLPKPCHQKIIRVHAVFRRLRFSSHKKPTKLKGLANTKFYIRITSKKLMVRLVWPPVRELYKRAKPETWTIPVINFIFGHSHFCHPTFFRVVG